MSQVALLGRLVDESPRAGGKQILLDSGGKDQDVNGSPYSTWGVVNENGRPRRVCVGLRRLHDPLYGGVTPPVDGNRHVPTSFFELAEMVDRHVRQFYGVHNGYHQRGHHITVSKCTQKVFGLLTMEAPGMEGQGWAVGWRGSINKTLGSLVAIGVSIWMCENLCLNGDQLKARSKNTKNGLAGMKSQVLTVLDQADGLIGNMCADIDAFKTIRLSKERMAELVGLAQYTGVVKSHQANRVYRQIDNPAHLYTESGLTLNDLLNHFTYGCKDGGGDRMFEQHGDLHTFCKGQMMGLKPVQVQVPLGLPSPLDSSSIHLVDPSEDYDAF